MEETNKTKRKDQPQEEMINPLRNEKVRLQFVPKKGGPMGDDPNHILAGGKAEGAPDVFSLPVLSSTGNYKNPLTSSEKAFLEKAMNLDFNALSVYGKFWDDYFISVTKDGISLDLSDPSDYLKYKVLLANNNAIAPSIEDMQDRPKATYQYVLVHEDEEDNLENAKMDATIACYEEFTKLDKRNDLDTMRVILEFLDARPYSATTPKPQLTSRINQLIQKDAKAFLRVIKDPMLSTKVLIRRATELGKLSKRGDLYYLRSDNSQLSDPGEDPTLSIAARWLNQPSHSDIKGILESEVERARTNG